MADDTSIPQFFLPLIPGFLTNFRIPKAFLKHLKLTDSSNKGFVAVLRDRNSDTDKAWSVRVDNDGRRFMYGWKEFALDHSLRVGDFLVVRYLGGVLFDVLILDPVTACDRSFAAMDSLNQSESVQHVTESERVSLPSEGNAEVSESLTTDVPVCSEATEQCIAESEPAPSRSEGDPAVFNPASADPLIQSKSAQTQTREQQPNVTERDKVPSKGSNEHNAVKRVEFTPSGRPYLHDTIKKSSLSWGGHLISVNFARVNNLAKRWCDVTIIDSKDRSWPVHLRHKKKGKDQVYFSKGWDPLRKANDLKLGDAMVFEIIDSGSEPVIKLHTDAKHDSTEKDST